MRWTWARPKWPESARGSDEPGDERTMDLGSLLAASFKSTLASESSIFPAREAAIIVTTYPLEHQPQDTRHKTQSPRPKANSPWLGGPFLPLFWSRQPRGKHLGISCPYTQYLQYMQPTTLQPRPALHPWYSSRYRTAQRGVKRTDLLLSCPASVERIRLLLCGFLHGPRLQPITMYRLAFGSQVILRVAEVGSIKGGP